jgi:hypothetical protein
MRGQLNTTEAELAEVVYYCEVITKMHSVMREEGDGHIVEVAVIVQMDVWPLHAVVGHKSSDVLNSFMNGERRVQHIMIMFNARPEEEALKSEQVMLDKLDMNA